MLALLAGSGELPRQVITTCSLLKKPIFIVAFTGQTDSELVTDYPHYWTHLGDVGGVIKRLHQEGIKEVIMAGHMHRPALSEIRLDGTALKLLKRTGWRIFGDNGLLSSIIELLEEEGFRVIAAGALIKELFCPVGILGQHAPNPRDYADIERGLKVAEALGTVDVGQAVVVQEGIVLGVESIEGTAKLLERVKEFRRGKEGGVLVKIAKPGQSHKVDLPTIGPDTIKQVSQAELVGIAMQKEVTQILQHDEVIRLANELNIFLIGV